MGEREGWYLVFALVAIVFASVGAREARAQQPTPTPGQGRAVVPRYNGRVQGDVSRVSLMNQFSTTLNLRNSIRASGTLRISESHYRLQDRRDETKQASSDLTFQLRPRMAVRANFEDRRYFNRVLTFSNEVQDLINNSQTATAEVDHRTAALGLPFHWQTAALVAQREETQQTTSNIEARIMGNLSLPVSRRIRMSARGFARGTRQSSDLGVTQVSGLGLREDSLKTTVRVALHDTSSVDVRYEHASYENEFMDLPRGVFQDQQFGSDLIRETQTRKHDAIALSATTQIIGGLMLNLDAGHSEDLNAFAIALQRFSEVTNDYLRADLRYRFNAKTKANFRITSSRTYSDLGPQSVGSNLLEDKLISGSVEITPRQGSKITVRGGISLLQTFYEDFELNPRDRDQRNRFANLQITSKIMKDINASVYGAITQTDYVFIDGSLSQNNRAETTFDFRPQLTFSVTDRVTIRQDYGLNIEFTDFRFDESENFLDRNITFSNMINTRLSEALSVEVYYALLLHDRGSYLAPEEGAERLLNIAQEDRRDQMDVSFRYKLNQHLTIIGLNEYSVRRDRPAGAVRDIVFEDGGIELGVEGSYDFKRGRRLQFALRRVKRFGRFNTPEQRDFWVMNSQINYTF